MNYLSAAMAFACGAIVPVQAAVNATLRTHLSSPMQAAFVNFAVGAIVLALYIFFERSPMPSASSLAQVPWWGWIGGMLGAFFVFSSLFVVPKLGAAAMLALIVAGQMTSSLLIDHFGVLNLAQQSITLWRVFGVGLVVVGAVITVAASK
ncbi:DMT family transporter [Candidatus Saccharibacteria bacterium]|nr:DMT family transporter [Candidatus Saccharibacteria bacterium]